MFNVMKIYTSTNKSFTNFIMVSPNVYLGYLIFLLVDLSMFVFM